MAKLILKECQVCGKTISKDNGNIETCICNIWEDGKACEIHNKEDKFSPRFLFNYINQLEVIGNIYENKELLDG